MQGQTIPTVVFLKWLTQCLFEVPNTVFWVSCRFCSWVCTALAKSWCNIHFFYIFLIFNICNDYKIGFFLLFMLSSWHFRDQWSNSAKSWNINILLCRMVLRRCRSQPTCSSLCLVARVPSGIPFSRVTGPTVGGGSPWETHCCGNVASAHSTNTI